MAAIDRIFTKEEIVTELENYAEDSNDAYVVGKSLFKRRYMLIDLMRKNDELQTIIDNHREAFIALKEKIHTPIPVYYITPPGNISERVDWKSIELEEVVKHIDYALALTKPATDRESL